MLYHFINGENTKACSYNFITIHGSRDYYHVKKDDVNYEIVPVLDIKDPKKVESKFFPSKEEEKHIRKEWKQNKKVEIFSLSFISLSFYV